MTNKTLIKQQQQRQRMSEKWKRKRKCGILYCEPLQRMTWPAVLDEDMFLTFVHSLFLDFDVWICCGDMRMLCEGIYIYIYI